MSQLTTPHHSSTLRRTIAILAIAALPLGIAGCASPGSGAETEQQSTEASAPDSAGLSFDAPWAKAADGMSGVFGTLTNGTDDEVTLTQASSPRAGLVELHETVMVDGQMIMRERDGGFTIPAGGSFELAPGEDHIMLMELDTALLPGEVLPMTLTFSNGDTLDLDIDVREFAGADENYGDLEHSDHDHGDHDHDHGDHDG